MYTIGKFAKKLGITVHTLRVWDKKNKLKPEYVSNGGHRYYSEEQLKELIPKLDVKKGLSNCYSKSIIKNNII